MICDLDMCESDEQHIAIPRGEGTNTKKKRKEFKHTTLRQLNQIQLLTLLRPRHMRRQERIHEGLEIRPPPLRQRVPNLPFVIDALAGELGADGSQAFVQSELKAFDFVVFGLEVISWSVFC